MIDLQDIYDSDFYQPYYFSCLYGCNPPYFRIRGYGYRSGSGTDNYEPQGYSSSSRSHDTVYELPKYNFLFKRGTSCYGPQDYSYRSGASCYEPRGYRYISGSGYDYRSSSEPCGFDPIPVGRSGYAYRRRYSCRPISGNPTYYGCRIYYPPSYWMEQNRYYGPC